MAYPKKVNAQNKAHQAKAILEHAGFVRFVSGKVAKIGLEKVLKEPEYLWLKNSFDRVLDFAEKVQLKELDKPLVDQSQHFHVTVEVESENTPASQTGDRISRYVEI